MQCLLPNITTEDLLAALKQRQGQLAETDDAPFAETEEEAIAWLRCVPFGDKVRVLKDDGPFKRGEIRTVVSKSFSELGLRCDATGVIGYADPSFVQHLQVLRG